MDRDREALHRAFVELRDADRRASPSFEAVLWRSRRPAVSASALWGIGVIAAAVIVDVVIALRSLPVPPEPTLSAWQAPSDALLRTPGIEVLRSVPSITSSVVDRFNTSANNPEAQ